MQKCTRDLIIQTDDATTTVRSSKIDWIAYDIILGRSWLSEASPNVDRKSNSVKLFTGDRFITLDTKSSEHDNSHQERILTGKQVARLLRKHICKVYCVPIRPSQNEKSYEQLHPEEGKELLKNYNDIFPDELPNGLLPSRNVELSIDLESNTKSKNGPVYKLSRKELNGLK